MRNAFFLAATLGLAACGSAGDDATSKNVLLTNDFESIEHWLQDEQVAATLTHEQAHSGQTALKVDDAHEHSLTFNKPLGHFQLALPARLRVSAWVLLPDAQATATLVASVGAPNTKPAVWEGLPLEKAVHSYGQWTQVSHVIALPAGLPPTHNLSFYLWHNAPGPGAYLDDLTVTREP